MTAFSTQFHKQELAALPPQKTTFDFSIPWAFLFRIPPAMIFLFLLAGLSESGELIAATRWPDEQVAGVFLCHADFSLKKDRYLLEELSQLQKDLVRTLGIDESREPIHLFLFQKKSTYQNYLKRYFPKAPRRRALFIKGSGPGMVFAYRHGDFGVDVRHESTHAMLHAALPMTPLWLDEGLAEYFETEPDKRAKQSPHLKKMKRNLKVRGLNSLKRLESISELSQMGSDEYRESWSWVHFMLHGPPEAHDELVRYLNDIAAHQPPGLLSERLKRRLPNLEQRYSEHFRKWR